MPFFMHGLRTVIDPSPNLAATKEWWSQFLGIEPYFDQSFSVGYGVGGYELGLLPTADVGEVAVTYWSGTDTLTDHGATVAPLGRGRLTFQLPASRSITSPIGAPILIQTATTGSRCCLKRFRAPVELMALGQSIAERM